MQSKEEIENIIGIRQYKINIILALFFGTVSLFLFCFFAFKSDWYYKYDHNPEKEFIYLLMSLVSIFISLIGVEVLNDIYRFYSFYEDGLYITAFLGDKFYSWDKFFKVKIEKHMFSKCICFVLKNGKKYRCVYSEEILYWLKTKCPLL